MNSELFKTLLAAKCNAENVHNGGAGRRMRVVSGEREFFAVRLIFLVLHLCTQHTAMLYHNPIALQTAKAPAAITLHENLYSHANKPCHAAHTL